MTVSFTCADALSGTTACPAAQALGEGADQSVSGTVTDKAGNSASASVTGTNVDKTAPTISASRTPLGNADGWNNTDVPVSFTCGDALSGAASCSGPVTLTAEGANQSATGSVTDLAGNTASATLGGVNIDKTAPVLTTSQNPGPNAFGWNNGPVTVSFNCSDGLSGLAGPCPG